MRKLTHKQAVLLTRIRNDEHNKAHEYLTAHAELSAAERSTAYRLAQLGLIEREYGPTIGSRGIRDTLWYRVLPAGREALETGYIQDGQRISKGDDTNRMRR